MPAAEKMPAADQIRAVVRRVVEELEGGSTAGEKAAASTPATGGEKPRRVAIGADHGGFALKQRLKAHLQDRGYEVHDCGTTGTEAVDYPDFAHAVARRVAAGESDVGVAIDGAGIGSCITANKVPGVRAAVCWDLSSARNSREHNLANVLTLGAGLLGEGLARQILDTWLETPWGGDRHARRVGKIGEVEAGYLRTPRDTV